MANFRAHLSVSTLLGLGYGGAALMRYDVPLPSCVLAAGLCGLSGMLPDIDSGPGRPLREITTLLAAVVPTMLYHQATGLGLSPESMILLGAALYALIRFGLAEVLKRCTVHRGMFHSLPAVAIFGELAFLALRGEGPALGGFLAGGVVLGAASHLVLDELADVTWHGRLLQGKGFGAAIKFFGHDWLLNLLVYAVLGGLTWLVLYQAGFSPWQSISRQVYYFLRNTNWAAPLRRVSVL